MTYAQKPTVPTSPQALNSYGALETAELVGLRRLESTAGHSTSLGNKKEEKSSKYISEWYSF